MDDFVELQSLGDHKLVKWVFRISFVLYGIGILLAIFNQKHLAEALLIVLAGTILLYFIFIQMKMKTVLNTNHLEINHPFIGNYQLPISEIASIEYISEANIPNNRRTHHHKLGTLYRMFGNEGLLIHTQSGGKFFLGSQNAQALHEKLNEYRKRFLID